MQYKKSELEIGIRDSFIKWLFFSLISQKGSFDKEPMWSDFMDREEFDITLTVQGVEVDFMKSMLRVEEHIHRMDGDFEKKVQDKAFELLEEKFGNIISATKEVLQTTTIDRLNYLISENDEIGNKVITNEQKADDIIRAVERISILHGTNGIPTENDSEMQKIKLAITQILERTYENED